MGQRLAKLVLLTTTLGGCSLIYSPGNLPPTVDAQPDAEVIADGNPDLLELIDVGPTVVHEGQGDGGSRPATVVIRGNHIAADATIDIRVAAGAATFMVGAPTIAANGRLIAVSMTIPVQDMLEIDVPLTVTVTQPGAGGTVTKQLDGWLTLRGLPELDASDLPAGPSNISLLKPLYSKIALMDSSWFGASRVQLRATSSITLVTIDASGGVGGATTAGAAGPGGCAGGAPRANGACAGGGAGGADSTALTEAGGGGGAGFFADGATGAGPGAGTGGPKQGSPQLATFEGFDGSSANKAAGGGGGGNALLATGGGGGGGGGTIEIDAGGNVQVTTITATGGKGADKPGQGGGGGGAGGAVLIRAGGTLTVMNPINVEGGNGGTGAGAGGKGSAGRVRWDATGRSNPAPSATTTPHRGPAFDVMTPALVRTPTSTYSMVGTTNDEVEVYVIDQDGVQRTAGTHTFSNGALSFDATLYQGLNRVCVTLKPGQRGQAEADECIEVAFLP